MVGGGAARPRGLRCLLGHRIARIMKRRIWLVEVHGNFPRLQPSGALFV